MESEHVYDVTTLYSMVVVYWLVVVGLVFWWGWGWALVTDDGAWSGAVVVWLVSVVMVDMLVWVAAKVLVEIDGGSVWAFHYNWYEFDVSMLIIPWLITVVTSDVGTLVVSVRKELSVLSAF